MAIVSAKSIEGLIATISPPQARYYLDALRAFRSQPIDFYADRYGTSVNRDAFFAEILPDLAGKMGLTSEIDPQNPGSVEVLVTDVIGILQQIVTLYPEQAANKVAQPELTEFIEAAEEHDKQIAQIHEHAALENKRKIDWLKAVFKQEIPGEESTPITADFNNSAYAQALVAQTTEEILAQLAVSEDAKNEIRQKLKEHDTLDVIATQLTHPNVLLPGDTVTPTQISDLETAIRAKIEHDLGQTESGAVTAAMTVKYAALIIPVKTATEAALAQKNGSTLIATTQDATPSDQDLKVSRTLESIQATLGAAEFDAIIENTVNQISGLTGVQKAEVIRLLKMGANPRTQAFLAAGFSSEALADLFKNNPAVNNLEAFAEVNDSTRGANALGVAETRTRDGRVIPLTIVSDVRPRANGELNASTRSGNEPSTSVNIVPSLSKKPSTNLAVLGPNGKLYALFSKNPQLNAFYLRITAADKLLTASIRQAERQFAHSAIGVPLRQINVFLSRTLPRQVGAWASRQAVVIAVRQAVKEAGKKAAAVAAKIAAVQIIKEGAKGLIATTVSALTTGPGAIAVAAVFILDLLKSLWDLFKALGPLLKKFLSDHPWLPVIFLFAPLFPALGLFGPALFGLGALGLLALTAGGGLAALGAGVGGTIGLILGFFLSLPIILPILIVVATFIGLWIFFTIFYQLFILPQAFLGNPPPLPAMVTVGGQVMPAFFTVTTNTSPNGITNGSTSQIGTGKIAIIPAVLATAPGPIITTTITISPQGTYTLSGITQTVSVRLIKSDGTVVDLPNAPYSWQAFPNQITTTAQLTATIDVKALMSANNLTSDNVKDSEIVTAFTISGSATDTTTGQTTEGVAKIAQSVFTIGTPPVITPKGWPAWGPSACITQGPNGPYSHSGYQAVDMGGIGALQPVYATHPGIVSWGTTQADGTYALVTAPDNKFSTLYAHLDNRTPPGPITKNAIVGYTTDNLNNGNMTGLHLHYELKETPVNGPEINNYLPCPAPIEPIATDSCNPLPGKTQPLYPVRSQYGNDCPVGK